MTATTTRTRTCQYNWRFAPCADVATWSIISPDGMVEITCEDHAAVALETRTAIDAAELDPS